MRFGTKIGLLPAGLAALCLYGCSVRPPAPGATTTAPAPAPFASHEGQPYDIVAGESLLRILVYRSGPLAKAGHNHVIASHSVTGSFYVPPDPLRASFEVHIPVADLTVDEPELRVDEHNPDFPPVVPDSAKQGTRHNMLSEALLDGEQYPEIVLRSDSLEGSDDPSRLSAHLRVTVRDHTSEVLVPVTYELSQGQLIVSGETSLKQTDLGLTPFSALLGALQVQDEFRVKFRFVAQRAPTHTGG